MVYVADLDAPLASMAIYPLREAQISALIQDETPTKVSPKYEDYADIFLFDLAIEITQKHWHQ